MSDSQWIKCSDRLPGTNSGPLKVKNNEFEDTAYFISWKEGYYFCIGQDTKQTWKPTHWMSLPPLPTETENKND